MTSPYINTTLQTSINVMPWQMDNNIFNHLKNNLLEKMEGYCFRQYGYVSKIYEILSYGDALIEAENPTASALYSINFTCRLCIPLRNNYIICKVDKVIPMLASLSNGPIRAIVTNDRINNNNFLIGKTGIFVKDQIKNIVRPLEIGELVRIKIDSKKFNNRDTIIMCMGILESIATKEECELYNTDEYNTRDFIEFNKHLEIENLLE
jgi:DNA-directed RNA polymerase subunit E'/Rpb7